MRNSKDEYEKANKNFHISERKANLVNAKKNVKSNFKALRSGKEISRVKK